MKLEVTKEAQEALKNKLEVNDQLLLDTENGDGPLVESQVSCQLDTVFRLIIVKKGTQTDLSLYPVVADTSIGPIRIKGSTILYMDDPSALALESTYNNLQLKGLNGLRKGSLQVARKDQRDKVGKLAVTSNLHVDINKFGESEPRRLW